MFVQKATFGLKMHLKKCLKRTSKKGALPI